MCQCGHSRDDHFARYFGRCERCVCRSYEYACPRPVPDDYYGPAKVIERLIDAER